MPRSPSLPTWLSTWSSTWCGAGGLPRRGGIENVESYAFARLFSLTILPWFVFIAWYAAAAFYGQLPTVFLEILYSNIAVLLAGICVLVMENSMEGIAYSRGFKAVILVLFVLSVSYYVIFTFRLPWADFFADPYAGLAIGTSAVCGAV